MKPHTSAFLAKRVCTRMFIIPKITTSAMALLTAITILNLPAQPAHAVVTAEDIEEVMTTHCVPKTDSLCDPSQIAVHTEITISLDGKKTTSCLCNTPGRAWVAETRTCEVPQCDPGYRVEMEANCGAGKKILLDDEEGEES